MYFTYKKKQAAKIGNINDQQSAKTKKIKNTTNEFKDKMSSWKTNRRVK